MTVYVPAPIPREQIPDEATIIRFWEGSDRGPLVTVICPTFNHERFIRNAINGFLIQQTSFPFEVIIHDDASTDNTAGIVREYERRYPRLIRAICQTENLRSQNRSWTEFVSPLVRGEFVAVCEGDDYWTDPRKLQDQAEYLIAHPDCSMVCQSHINAEVTSKGIFARGGIREMFLTLTRMYRTSIRDQYPKELLGIPNGDRGILVHCATHGRIASLPHLLPAVRVMHSGGAMSMQPTNVQLDRQVRTWDQIFQYYSGTRFAPALRLKLAQMRQRQHAYLASRSSGPQRWVAKFGSLWLRARIFVMRRLGYQKALPAIFTS